LRGDLFVARRQRWHPIASSSRLDLAPQAPSAKDHVFRTHYTSAAENATDNRQLTTDNSFSAGKRIALPFRHFSFQLSSSNPAKSLRKLCGKKLAQRDVQKMRKKRGKSADSAVDILRESG